MPAEPPPAASLAEVAVITVSYNSNSHLPAFLESVRQERDAVGAPRLVVVDNGSSDLRTVGQIAEAAGAELLASPRNLGYGGAINLAASRLEPSFRYVLISNPDVRVEPGSLGILLRTLDADADIGAAGPMVLNPDGTVYPSARRLPSLSNGIGHGVLATVWPSNPWSRRYRAEEADPLMERDAGWLSGSCLLVRRSAFDAIGGFDDGFFMYFEDVDLGARLVERGWRNRYVPTARVVHTGGHSTEEVSARMLEVHHASAYRYLAKRYRAPYQAPLRLAIRVGLAIRYRFGRLRSGGQSTSSERRYDP